MSSYVLIVLGVLLLYGGGELLVRGVVRLAAALRTSSLVIGLTVVAFGTSSPEVAVVVGAGLDDQPAIALGNVFGSNIANIGLILGLVVLFRRMDAHESFLRRDMPFLVAVTLLLPALGALVDFGTTAALVLLLLMSVYMVALIRGEGAPEVDAADVPAKGSAALAGLVGVLGGIGLLVWGADVLVDAAVDVAHGLGVPERVIGLTLVAFGTSLPELASCVVAAFKGHSDFVLGNIVGSNLFNTMMVLPVGLLVRPTVLGRGDYVDIGISIGFTLMLAVALKLRPSLSRPEGLVFVAAYALYVGLLYRGAI